MNTDVNETVDRKLSSNLPTLSVVLCTYNGATHLAEQLRSIAEQTLYPDQIIASDDGSNDSSLDILRDFKAKEEKFYFRIIDGPRKGYAVNFLNTLRTVSPSTEFTAFADQDDIWFPEKLERAVETLRTANDTPALYGAATLQCDENLNPLGVSRIATVELGFRHAITQNFAGGNTMVLNNAALKIVQNALQKDINVQAHDWWLYQLISAAGGKIVFDETPVMHYRQHSANAVGSADGLTAKIKRINRMLRKDYKGWNTQNFEALKMADHLLTPENREILDQVIAQRDGTLFARASLMRSPGIYRQTILGQFGLFLALALKSY